ncbi:MAG: acyltransferase [Lachnospiraceae bacterium]|nr:acyltransferase [Lachnospiraceae bacterium]
MKAVENKSKNTKEQVITGVFFGTLALIILWIYWITQHNVIGSGILAGIFAVAIIIHIFNAQTEGYIKSCFARSDVFKSRSRYYDILRLIACLGVIETHAIQLALSEKLIENKVAVFIYTWLYVICLVCNPIYVALSGGLLLEWKNESIGKFYIKRFIKVIIPLAVYFIFYLCMYKSLPVNIWEAFKLILIKLVSGNTPEAPHFWLIYAILSIYVVVPFFRYLFKHMPYKILSAFALVILFFMTLDVFLPLVYAPIAINTFMSGWIGVAVLGYWITRPESRKYDFRIIIAGGISAVFIAFCIYQNWDFKEICCNTSPVMVLLTGGIFAVILRNSQKEMKKAGPILSLLSKYSYGIILIHWWILRNIKNGFCGIDITSWGYVGGTVVTLICALVMSLFMAFILDNLCVIVVEKGAVNVINCLTNIVTKWQHKIRGVS